MVIGQRAWTRNHRWRWASASGNTPGAPPSGKVQKGDTPHFTVVLLGKRWLTATKSSEDDRDHRVRAFLARCSITATFRRRPATASRLLLDIELALDGRDVLVRLFLIVAFKLRALLKVLETFEDPVGLALLGQLVVHISQVI